jgi:hypothetical protein
MNHVLTFCTAVQGPQRNMPLVGVYSAYWNVEKVVGLHSNWSLEEMLLQFLVCTVCIETISSALKCSVCLHDV